MAYTDPSAKRIPKPKKSNFLFNTVIFALLAVGITHAFEPYVMPYVSGPTKQVGDSEVTTHASTAKTLDAAMLRQLLERSTKPTVVFFYASWCSYCRLMMPGVAQLWREGAFAGTRLLLISLDKKVTDMSRYLLEHELEAMANPPLVLQPNPQMPITRAMQPLGSSFSGRIPYIGFFAAGGRIVSEIEGLTFRPTIEKSLQRLKTP